MKNTWWQKLSNPSRFISDITAEGLNGNSMVIELPPQTPWIQECEEEIKEVLQSNMDRALDMIEDDADSDPGEIILQKYCKPEKRLAYRPAIGYAKFLGESDDITLNEAIVWINGLSEDRAAVWSRFVADYTKARGEQTGGIFILLGHKMPSPQLRKGLKSYIYGDYTNEFDTYVFTMIMSSETRLKPQEKRYLATLVSELVGSDAELSQMVSSPEYYNRFLKKPAETLEDIVDSKRMSNGRQFCFPCSKDELRKRIWKAQIKILFPLIEEYRGYFVQINYSKINANLPLANSVQGEEPYREPEEVEIGALHYLAINKKIDLPYKNFKELTRVKNARNSLAHLGPIDYDEVKWLLTVLPDDN